MLRIRQVKLVPKQNEDLSSRLSRLRKKLASLLGTDISKIKEIHPVKESVDARKKPEVFWVYTVDVLLDGVKEEAIVKKIKGADICVVKEGSDGAEPRGGPFVFSGKNREKNGENGPVTLVTGAGPAGLFAAYRLVLSGHRVILIERGKSVDERAADVDLFWAGRGLDPESNVLFGEGGAGTFSDGKLNTGIRDADGGVDTVLRTFVRFGAPSSILYEQHPHVGTDVLRRVIRNMRNEIIALGGEVRFGTKLTGLFLKEGRLQGICVNDSGKIECEALILATGHSGRDTFRMLKEAGIKMEPKSFAAGYRLMHEQSLINLSQYGERYKDCFGAAPYKLTAKTRDGRGVYSFCMCPGGYVVNASANEDELCINGMSYSGRSGKWANSAIVVAVDKNDYTAALREAGCETDPKDPLLGVYFQQLLEKRAFLAGGGRIPVQRLGDYMEGRTGSFPVDMLSDGIKGEYAAADLRGILPGFMEEAFLQAMNSFGRKIKGFDRPGVFMAAVESRTSSPVRILRDKDCACVDLHGLFPCGEGAGYAGGIVSAAVDGIRVARSVEGFYNMA